MKGASQRRARPMDLHPALTADHPLPEPLAENVWIEPIPDSLVVPTGGDPADVAIARESVRLAFVAALQRLPPKQRAVLILREVLHWRAQEVADLLDTSVASVNSALQRAELDDTQRELLAKYVSAFERYDMDDLTSILREDAVWNMPPFDMWLQTHDDIERFCLGPGIGCKDSVLIPTVANGLPAFGQYKPDLVNGGREPWALQVVELGDDGRIAGVTFFLDTARFFPLFGLPPRLDD
jgi:RNA polymerase sigma-70 factor (ECF subfamily)